MTAAAASQMAYQGNPLSANVLGLELANPLMLASGPLSDSEPQIRRAMAAGAGAVVSKTIFAGRLPRSKERIETHKTFAYNSTTFSHRPIAQWLDTIADVADDRSPLIVSIHADTPQHLAELARAVVDAGAPALELGICCPIDDKHLIADPRSAAQYVTSVQRAVDVPFSVKLSALGDFAAIAHAVLDEGASAVSMSDSLPSLLVDVDQQCLPLGASVGYSGTAIKPIVLHAIHELRATHPDASIIGIGGISSARDVLEYLHVGATAVQIYTALMRAKLQLFNTITSDLNDWCDVGATALRDHVGTLTARTHQAAGRLETP